MRRRFFAILPLVAILMGSAVASAEIVTFDQQRLLVQVDVQKARWSAQLKGTGVRLCNISFLPGDDTAGWSITHQINDDDSNSLGTFVTVTLHGAKPGELDFDYRLSISKTGNDILVQLGRTNRTGGPVDIGDMDYMVAGDARLGGTNDRWLSFGVKSLFDEYHDLTLVKDFGDTPETSKRTYEVCHLVRHADTGNVILMGHLTVHKGHSRFEFAKTDSSTSMKARAYCHYDVSVPSGESFAGEKLLVHLGHDGIRALEHLGDLIALANDIRLQERRPLDLENRALIGCAHCRWIHWMSDGKAEQADRFIKEHGLDKFYYSVVECNPRFGGSGHWGLCYSGGRGKHAVATEYPSECYLRYKIRWGDGRVLDFSNPLAVDSERKRVAEFFKGKEDKIVWGRLDFAELWRKWPKQQDPFLSAPETWRLGAEPWRDAIDTISPGSRNRSCMARVDFSYGQIDICRTSQDADGNYVPGSYSGPRTFLGESAPGTTMRFFYNSRVFWNDCDNIHVYKYDRGRIVPYGEAKVRANFHAIAGSTMYPSEAFDVPYPANRLELLKRAAPPTADAAYPVDLFVRNPAQVWNMPVERPFGSWNIVAVFNFGPVRNGVEITSASPLSPCGRGQGEGSEADGVISSLFPSDDFTAVLDAEKDLRLDPAKTYLVYEFWSRKFLGTFRGTFRSKAIPQKDCDVYCIVEQKDRPVLLSTSRHVRQMAFDVKSVVWDDGAKQFRGISRAVSGDPYQLRIYIPDGYGFDSVDLPRGLKATTTTDGPLLIVQFTTSTDDDVSWTVSLEKQQRPNRLLWEMKGTGDVLFSLEDIVRFDWDRHVFELTREKAMDFMACQAPHVGLRRDFQVRDAEGVLYEGRVISPVSSISHDGPTIIEPSYELPPPQFEIRAGYPGAMGEGGRKRFHPRLRAALKKAGKLAVIPVDEKPTPIAKKSTEWVGARDRLKVRAVIFPETFRIGAEARAHVFFAPHREYAAHIKHVDVHSTLTTDGGAFFCTTDHSMRDPEALSAALRKGVTVLRWRPWGPVYGAEQSEAKPGPGIIRFRVVLRDADGNAVGDYKPPPLGVTILPQAAQKEAITAPTRTPESSRRSVRSK